MNFLKKYPAFFLILQCAFMGGLMMFICMAAGEIFVDPQMFGGFLSLPHIWPLIFLESAVWLIPFMAVVLPLLKKLKNVSPLKSASLVAALWIAVGTLVVIGYKLTYYPKNWSLRQIARADITFGWTIPCVLILALFIFFSLKYLEQIRNPATANANGRA